jgi:glycosyltransferase involved in cell wall biosynthesis
MKLLYITPYIEGVGGVPRVLSVKTNYLIEKWDYDISILATNSGITDTFYDFNKKIDFYSEKPTGKNLFYLYNYSKIINRYIELIKPDIVIVCDNGFKGYCVPFLLSKKIKLIFENHATKYIIDKKDTLFSRFLNILKFKFYNTCVSKYDKCIILVKESKKEFSSDNLVLIPNALWFSTDKKAELKNKSVIAIGRHSYEKGFERMLDIWKKIIVNYPDWTLNIYGKSNAEIDIEQYAKKIGIQKNVSFYGNFDEIIDKYVEGSIYIMTSHYEGFGMVLIEAMAFGLPVIAYDCPVGPGDVISNNVDGYLIENGNKKHFVEKLTALIENQDLRKQLGKNGQKSVLRFDLEIIMNQWNELFISLKNDRFQN